VENEGDLKTGMCFFLLKEETHEPYFEAGRKMKLEGKDLGA
jgi:hypothetical protein